MLLLQCLLCLFGLSQAFSMVPGRAFDRFITIWLENQDFAPVSEDPHFAALKGEGVLLTRYYALTHPSQPNYLAAVGGDYFGLNHDGFIRVPENVSTVADVLDYRNISWKGYFEDMPGPGFMGQGSDGSTGNGGWDYVRKHNPFISYDSINKNGTRLWNLESMRGLRRDLREERMPQFVFMSPNMMNDGHNTSLGYATAWVSGFLRPLLDDQALMNRTLVLLTYDETATYRVPNRIASLLLGGAVPAGLRGTEDGTFYTHYSILSTIENNWGLPNLGRFDVGANVFQVVTDITGYVNKEPPNTGSVSNSISYPGAYNDKHSSGVPIPPPNLRLRSAGGLPVLESVRKSWGKFKRRKTPYDGSGALYDGGENRPVYKTQRPNRS